MKKFITICSLFFLLLSLNGCVKNNPLPVYLHINPWKLEANPVLNGKEGDLFNNFDYAAVYVGNDILGYFHLPCTIPILKFGNQRVTLSPVIKNNGLTSVKMIYPFVNYYYTDINMEAGGKYTVDPVTSYNDDVVFAFNEDFESASLKIMNDASSQASISQEPHSNDGFSGYKGVIHLTSENKLWLGNTFADMVLPKGGKPVYLEMDYRTPVRVSTGVISISSENVNTINPNVAINGQKELKWNKIYIDLTDIVSYTANAEHFELYFQSLLPDSLTDATIELDNIKVVHF